MSSWLSAITDRPLGAISTIDSTVGEVQAPPSLEGLLGIEIRSRFHLVLSGMGCLLDSHTCIELGERGVATI